MLTQFDKKLAAGANRRVTNFVSRPGRWFWLVLAGGLVARLVLLPIPNTDDDTVFQTWSRVVTVDGFHTIYDVYDPVGNPMRECQYPPGYLYVLWLVGTVYQLALSPEFQQETIAFLMMLRVPTVVADLALGALLFFSVRSWRGPLAAIAVHATYTFLPATVLDSTIVTQIDAVQSLLMVTTILLLVGGRTAASVACLTLAILTKPQTAILVPVVFGTAVLNRSWRQLVQGILASAGVALALSLPFLLNGRAAELVRVLVTPVGTAPYLSLNAYNFWWLVMIGDGWQSDADPLIGGVSGRVVGLVMFGLATAAALVLIARDRGRETILLASAFVAFSFFMLCTEMTERYSLACVPFFLLLAPSGWGYRWISALLAITVSLNLYLVFPVVALTPGEALQLPHSNFFYYVDHDPLPVARLFSEGGKELASMWIAAAHTAVWIFVAGLVARGIFRRGR